jgi:hypothetical protein
MAMLAETRREGIPLVFTARAEEDQPFRRKNKRDESRPE